VAVPRTSRSGWGRAGHRRAVLIGALAFALVIGGSVAAWAEVSGSSAGYRLVTVTRADIADTLTVVGSVTPVSQAAAAFQVGGKVTSVSVTPGSQVTAGETLGTLDTTALSETVASDESAVNADEAKLAEDEANQSGTGSSSSSPNASSPAKGTTTTTSPSNGGAGSGSGSGGQGSTDSATVTKDQNTLTRDEAALSKDQQKEAADLAQAQTDCTSANTSTPSGQAACESALQTVSADEQAVSADQATVSKDETALAQALTPESSGGSGSGSTTGNSGPASHAVANESAFTGNSGAGGSPGTSGNGSSSPSNSSGGGTSGNTDTPEQIASDQAAIDTAQANLTEAQQSLKEATLTSPINGTVVSAAISTGETVSAGSSTEIITILGTNSYEVEATLDSSQIPSVKVGQAASVEVDGVDGNLEGTVSQVGPLQSSSSGYSYPVIVALPPSSSSDMHSGSTGNVTITTGSVSNVVAVPTSAVQSFGSTSYVTELSKSQLTRKVIKVGMVGDTYTQVDSGLSPGQSVVLVDYAEAVPSSNNNTNLGSVLGGGGGAGGFFGGTGGFPGGGAFRIQNIGGGSGGGIKGG
jgi:multidrug efflux pump subunit AcrA (membrane-fusion protein)